MVNLIRNHPRKCSHHSANYLHSPKAQALPKMFTTNTIAGVAWSQTHTLSDLYLATLQWKLDRSPGAAESSGVQPKASHQKALTCYPPTDLLISSFTKSIYLPTKEKRSKIIRSGAI